MDPSPLNRLRLVDWNFPNAGPERGLHAIHPYPAKFIPQIPRELIRILHPGDGSAVLDPFCGSGTTLVESAAAGHPAVGVDLNPVATLIARVKTRPPAARLAPIAAAIVTRARHAKASVPPIPRVDHWFEADVQRALAALVEAIGLVGDLTVSEALRVCLSSIVVRVSNQDGDTRYAAVKKRTSAALVFDLFARAAASLDTAYAEEYGTLFDRPRPPVRVITQNVLDVTHQTVSAKVGLVITSPPYPNAYEYWLYHKYRMYWLGFDPIAVRASEIGARPHYFKKNHHTEEDFEADMTRVFGLLATVATADAYACFIVGRSIIHGRVIDNAALLERAALAYRFRRVADVVRSIPLTRKAFNPAHGAINSESLLVFRR